MQLSLTQLVKQRKAAGKIHVWKEELVLSGGKITASARIEGSQFEPARLWYEVPAELAPFLTDSCDPFVVGTIMLAMRYSADLVVHGPVSPSLIQNLAEFQAAWVCWRPDTYSAIEVAADQLSEAVAPQPQGLAVAAFSGGLDSAFTIYRHKVGTCSQAQRNIEAGLLVHGFDIPFEQSDAFERAAGRAKGTLASLGMTLLTMASNHRHLNPEWNDTHGVGLASCLMLLGGRYNEGLIASTYSYSDLFLPWGSNPVTDSLLSSRAFRIVHDGARAVRPFKAMLVAEWPEAFENLRVCFSAPQSDENCCHCSKCTFTLLLIWAAGLRRPASFRDGISVEKILALRNLDDNDLELCNRAVEQLRKMSSARPLGRALQRCARYNKLRKLLEKPLTTRWLDRLRVAFLRLHQLRGP